MAIWSRDKQFGAGVGGFNAADGADGSNNNSIVPATTRFGLIFSNIVDATLTRSKVLATALYRSLQSQLHKEEDRATGSNIGVSGTGIESTQTVYTTPEQLPEVSKNVDDFTVAVIQTDGNLTSNQDMFEVSVINTDRKNKSFNVSFSSFGIKWLKARTTTYFTLIEQSAPQTIDTFINRNVLVTDMSFSTPNDGITRNLKIDFKATVQFPRSYSTKKSYYTFSIVNITDSITYDIGTIGLINDTAATESVQIVCLNTIKSILPNKTLNIKVIPIGDEDSFGSIVISKATLTTLDLK